MTRPEVLAIIPARGGSKGIPRKNIRVLAGRPLLAWSIEAAKAAVNVTDVVVSSDDVQILSVAAGAGARAMVRPAELATDTASTDGVLLNVLDQIRRRGGDADLPDLVVTLQPTSPVRAEDLVDRCIRHLRETGADAVLTASPAHFVWNRDEDGVLRCNAEPLYARPRRQSITPRQARWNEDGSVYVTRTSVLLETGNRLGGRVELVENEWTPEVDNPFEFWIAERMIRFREMHLPDGVDGILERMREGARRA